MSKVFVWIFGFVTGILAGLVASAAAMVYNPRLIIKTCEEYDSEK